MVRRLDSAAPGAAPAPKPGLAAASTVPGVTPSTPATAPLTAFPPNRDAFGASSGRTTEPTPLGLAGPAVSINAQGRLVAAHASPNEMVLAAFEASHLRKGDAAPYDTGLLQNLGVITPAQAKAIDMRMAS